MGQSQAGAAPGRGRACAEAFRPPRRKGVPPPKEVYSNPSKRELDGWVVAGLRTDDLLSEYDALFRSQRPGIHRCLLQLMIYQLMFNSTRLVRPPGLAALAWFVLQLRWRLLQADAA